MVKKLVRNYSFLLFSVLLLAITAIAGLFLLSKNLSNKVYAQTVGDPQYAADNHCTWRGSLCYANTGGGTCSPGTITCPDGAGCCTDPNYTPPVIDACANPNNITSADACTSCGLVWCLHFENPVGARPSDLCLSSARLCTDQHGAVYSPVAAPIGDPPATYCNNNKVCDTNLGETREACPNDCTTSTVDGSTTCSTCLASGQKYLCKSSSWWGGSAGTSCSSTDISSRDWFGTTTTACQACDQGAAPTVTTTPPTLACDPDKAGISLNKINTADFAWWLAEFIGTKTSKDADCKSDQIIDIFDFNKLRDLNKTNG